MTKVFVTTCLNVNLLLSRISIIKKMISADHGLSYLPEEIIPMELSSIMTDHDSDIITIYRTEVAPFQKKRLDRTRPGQHRQTARQKDLFNQQKLPARRADSWLKQVEAEDSPGSKLILFL